MSKHSPLKAAKLQNLKKSLEMHTATFFLVSLIVALGLCSQEQGYVPQYSVADEPTKAEMVTQIQRLENMVWKQQDRMKEQQDMIQELQFQMHHIKENGNLYFKHPLILQWSQIESFSVAIPMRPLQ